MSKESSSLVKSGGGSAPSPEKDSNSTIQRKPRKSPIAKLFTKYYKKGLSYTLPLLRYSIIPAMLCFSVYFTKPTPTFFELLNPLF